MKTKLLFLLSSLVLIAASCSNNREEHLLETVPLEASYIGVVRLDKLSSQLGDEGQAALKEILDNSAKSLDSKWKYFFSDESQVDFSSPLVIFSYKRATIATFMVKSESKFREAMEKATGSTFIKSDGVESCAEGTIYLKENQAWFATSYPQVESADIASFLSLSEKESIVSQKFLSQLLDHKDDITTFVNIEKIMEGSLDFQSRMAVNMIFDDASYMISHTSLEKDKIENEIVFLNYKSEPTSLAIKTSKIDTKSIREFSGKGDFCFAISVDPELVKALVRQVKNFAPIPSDIRATLEDLDGDVIVSANVKDSTDILSSLSVMLTFNSSASATAAAEFLKNFAGGDTKSTRIFTDGKKCYFMADVQGASEVSPYAESFKNANLGVVILPTLFNSIGKPEIARLVKEISIMLYDDNKGAKIKSVVNLQEGSNSLVTILKLVGKQ